MVERSFGGTAEEIFNKTHAADDLDLAAAGSGKVAKILLAPVSKLIGTKMAELQGDPFRDTAVMGTRTASMLAEAVAAVATLRCGSRWNTGRVSS